jgi:transcription termination factor Rho
MDIKELENKDADELARIGGDLDVADADALAREELMERILQRQSEQQGQRYAAGILDIVEDGYGFLRRRGLMPSVDDIYVSSSHVRRFSLRAGDRIAGIPRPPKKGEKYWGLVRVETVNGIDPNDARRRPHFDELTPIHPTSSSTSRATPRT